jgi:hypothetical protein
LKKHKKEQLMNTSCLLDMKLKKDN